MSRIDIRHPHSLPLSKARKAIDAVAEKLAERFGIEHGWDGDVLDFTRPGVDGTITLSSNEIHVQAKLGFLAAMFKDSIEAEIRRVLQERF